MSGRSLFHHVLLVEEEGASIGGAMSGIWVNGDLSLKKPASGVSAKRSGMSAEG